MDSQRLHLRSTVILDQSLLSQLPPVSAEFELLATAEARIVANTVVVAGGTLDGYHLKLIAETITALDPAASIALGLVNHTAPNLFNGRPGHPLTVVAARLNGGGGTTRGQRGGKGPRGRDGVDMPEIPQPEPQPGDPDGPPIQDGRNGEKGGDGLKGGDGGPVTLLLMEPSTHTGHWLGVGGTPGEGGNGGLGESMPFPSIDGEPGDPGDPGLPGDDKPASVTPVDVAGYRQGIAAALVLLDWARFRRQLAVEEFRRDNAAVALDELDAAVELVAADERPSLADELPALVRDNRTVTGVARDQDLVPDIAHFAGEYQTAADRLRAAITDPDGFLLLADPTERLHAIRAALDVVTSPGGELTVQTNDLADRAERALTAVIELRARTFSTLNRLDALLDPASGVSPVITLPGPAPAELDAGTVAAGLADVLGAKDPAAAPAPAAGTVLIPEPADGPPFRPELDPVTLLPANLELLVHRSVRDQRILLSTQVSAIAARAAGLAGVERWPDVAAAAVDADGVPVAVHLGRVAADLRAADGDRRVLDLLVELAEITHVWRLARARIEQILAGARTVAHQQLLAGSARGAFFPLEPEGADLLPGLRCLLDALAWRAERAERAADILTFGLTRAPAAEIVRYPLHPELHGDLSRLAPVIHAPDWERDLRESTPGHFQPLEYDVVLAAVTGLDHVALYDEYLERGIPLVGAGPPSVTHEFHIADRPDVFTRFASGAGNFWFDVTLGDVAGAEGTVAHRETRVVGIKITLDFEADAPVSGVTLLATHTGLSVQRDLDGTEHRQQMLPAAVEVGLSVPEENGTPASQTLEGEVRIAESAKVAFAAYGRGAAAGWLIAKADNTVDLDGLQTIRVEVFYEGIVEHGTVSLRSVASAPAASQVGSDLAIVVRLTAPAPNAVPVFLSSSDPTVIKTPPAIVVPAGQVEARALASVVGPTGGLRPTISARTADGVTRQVRPIVPQPRRPITAAVRLTSADVPGHIASVAVLPGPPGQPGQPLATLSPLPAEPGGSPPPCFVHHRRADLGLVRQAQVGNGPRSLAVDPGRQRIYVANSGTGSISVSMLDAGTLTTLGEQVVGSIIDVEVDAGAGLVYASRFNPGEIIVLSADDLSIVARLTDPDGRLRRPHGMAIVPAADGGAAVYVARTARGIPDEESAVTQIRRDADGTHTVVQSLRFAEVGTQPVDVAVDPVHDLVFVACLGGGGVPPRLIVLEHPTLTELGRVRLLSTGRAVATRPGSGLAYVVGEAGLMIVDGTSRTLASRVVTGGFPIAVAVDPATGTAYVGRRDDATLVRVDPPRSGTPTFW